MRDDPAPPMDWLVVGMIPARGLTTLAGAPASGKSALAAALAVAVATGSSWLGLRVPHGAALFISAEAADSTERRIRALVGHHNPDVPIAFGRSQLNLAEDGAAAEISKALDKACSLIGQDITLIIIDALGSSTRGSDENSGRDMGKATGALLQIAAERRLAVVLLAHTGKSGQDWNVRGHSGLLADVDAHLVVRKARGSSILQVKKLRDGEDGKELPFEIVEVGDSVSVRSVDLPQSGPLPGNLSGDIRTAFEALAGLGEQIPEKQYDREIGLRFADKKPGAMRQARSAAKRTLKESGLIEIDQGTVRVTVSGRQKLSELQAA